MLDDTIAAVSTPLGKGGIGIVRLSGKEALSIADKIFQARDGQKPSAFKTYTVHYGWIIRGLRSRVKRGRRPEAGDRGPGIVDEVLLTVMRAPGSYTREDIVEISCHSGIVVLREILDLVLSCGARPAEAGEFTKRAFLNGRIDLSKAEAVLDIINAKTNLGLASAVNQLRGGLFNEVRRAADNLLEVIALLEANIDFPEEDIGEADKKKINRAIALAAEEIGSLLDSSSHGKVLREGISAVILGRANVGKSSLLNALLKEERAIVTPIPGTTRDCIEEILDLKGIPLKIADTAGIIEPRDLIEEKALGRTQSYFEKADLVLLVFDGARALTHQDIQLMEKAKRKPVIVILNKSDLKVKIDETRIKKYFRDVVRISALHHQGLKELEEKIIQSAWQGKIEPSSEVMVTNSRHAQALRDASALLASARDSLNKNLSVEFISEDLKACLFCLRDITGETIRDDILDKIFNEFCIGK
ncbi:tRNA uridine-5-carboxymethylaminomethyl(34) synthesis GTPase MnmE [bacterium]|nr:MAG: tRNA uridine-5-carboxymethylaminomethyl(34) synthesis GTPase MnmE [bacterium]